MKKKKKSVETCLLVNYINAAFTVQYNNITLLTLTVRKLHETPSFIPQQRKYKLFIQTDAYCI